MLAAEEQARCFAGVARLCGQTGAQRIQAAHVAVVGLGGVGSWVAEALARSGVGALTLIDLDHVAPSNINRQAQALVHTLGQAKVQAMRERIAQINPHCWVRIIEEFVSPENWPALLEEYPGSGLEGQGLAGQHLTLPKTPRPVNAMVDACDQSTAKLALCAWALKNKETVFITVGAAGGKRQAHQVDIADLAQVHHDRLLAGVRSRLRRQNALSTTLRTATTPLGIACVFSPEPATLPQGTAASNNTSPATGQAGPTTGLSCHGYGSWVSVTATFGFCAAGWVLNRLAGKTS
jgi:tRNA A37 threonylcarbamoyladenosine dehydratase